MVWNQGIFRILFCVVLTSYVEIIPEATISIVFPYPDVCVIIDKYVLSSSHKLADAYPADILDSCFGTQIEDKNTWNDVIEV